MIMEWANNIQFPAGRPGDDKPKHEATYISKFRVEETEENKGDCLFRIYIILTFIIIPGLRSLQ